MKLRTKQNERIAKVRMTKLRNENEITKRTMKEMKIKQNKNENKNEMK